MILYLPDEVGGILEVTIENANGLATQGVLYRDFQDTTDFVRQVKDHLYNLIVDEWKNSEWESTDTPAQGQLGRTGVDATILTESGRGNDVSNVAPLDRPTGNS